MLSSTSLLSLNHDILRELLAQAHLLLDTPCELNRAAILRTCYLLHDLGLPFLYRVVDLTGFSSARAVEHHWTMLFGRQGLCAEGGRAGGKVGRFVRELRLGSRCSRNIDVEVSPALRLVNCTSLLLDLTRFPVHNHISSLIISQLPITRLVLAYSPNMTIVSRPSGGEFGADVLELAQQPSAWDCLETIVFDDRLWYDHQSASSPRLALSSWSFKTLVVRVDTSSVQPWDLKGEGFLAAKLFFFFGPTSQSEADAFLPQTDRVEFRLRGRGAAVVEAAFRAKIKEHVGRGLSAFEKRVAKMIVFVGEDGTERKLVEGL